MQNTLTFGVAIAFATPGLIVLWAVSLHSQTVSDWFGRSEGTDATIGGFLFVLLASVALGVFVQGVRKVCLEELIKKWGKLKRPELDFSKIATGENLAAFQLIVEDRYRYYQFYSNTLVAVVIAYGSTWLANRYPSEQLLWSLALVVPSVVVLWLSARDSLKGYYDEASDLIPKGEETADDKRTRFGGTPGKQKDDGPEVPGA